MKFKTISISIHFFLCVSILILLSSCQKEKYHQGLHHFSKLNKDNLKLVPPQTFYSEYKLPIAVSSGDFNKGIGWLDNEEIVYLSDELNGSSVYRHNLKSGNSKALFKSPYPIVSAVISHDRKRILIHASPSTYEGLVTIINSEGEVTYSKKYPSFEIVFEWNQYNSNQLLITTFNEDWTFKNYYLNLGNNELKMVDIRKPFAKWIDENKLAFLDWDENSISLFSPLIQKDLNKGELLLKEGVFQFDTFQNLIFTITVDLKKQKAIYSFFSNEMEKQTDFKAPILSNYSGWVVPNYEMASDHKNFLAMLPFESTEADTYKKGFQLVSFNFKTGKKEILIKKTDNAPFTCSPNGNNCLIGNQFEKLFNVKEKILFPLLDEK